jgi:hypothetical protein
MRSRRYVFGGHSGCNTETLGREYWASVPPMDDGTEYAIMWNDGNIERTFDTIEEAQAALFVLPTPVGAHPMIAHRVRSELPTAWVPVSG